MGSSYQKIYDRIWSHSKCKQLLQAIEERINSTEISAVNFRLVEPWDGDGDGNASAFVTFQISAINSVIRNASEETPFLAVNDYYLKHEVKSLVEVLFGNEIPTYNCKKIVILGENRAAKQESFFDFFQSKSEEMLGDQLREKRQYIEREMDTHRVSEDTQRRKQEFLVQSAMNRIRSALRAYEFLGKEVLVEAINEYVVGSILEG